MNKKEYLAHFSGEQTEDKKHKAALKFALDTRKFEIELYWKRATYFWAFIAVTFAAYGLVQKLDDESREFLTFFLSCLGFVLSVGWVLANRGSKQWQENWEHHVDHLEDAVMGPLYKLTMPRATPSSVKEWAGYLLVGPSRHSVSKINQLLSIYIAFLWMVLIARAPTSWNLCMWNAPEIAILVGIAISVPMLVVVARTHSGPYGHTPHLRESQVIESES